MESDISSNLSSTYHEGGMSYAEVVTQGDAGRTLLLLWISFDGQHFHAFWYDDAAIGDLDDPMNDDVFAKDSEMDSEEPEDLRCEVDLNRVP